MAQGGSTKLIWKVFFILLVLTSVEVGLGMYNSHSPGFISWTILKWTFIIMTLVKAYYIVAYFMHVRDEKRSLQLSLLVPMFILIPYLIFIILAEATYVHGTM